MNTFDKIKFPVFLEVKPLDNTGLAEVVPEVWLDFKQEVSIYLKKKIIVIFMA